MITVDEITTLESLSELSPHWEKLLRKTAAPDLFRTPEWSNAWWRSLSSQNKTLYILAVKDDNNLIGIAPFMEVKESFFGIPIKKIEFVSMWKYAGSAASCLGMMDFIIAERYDEVMEAIINHLWIKQKTWDFIRLHPIPSTSYSFSSLKIKSRAKGLIVEDKFIFATAVVYPNEITDSYTSGLSAKLKKNLRAAERKLAREGAIKYVEHTTSEHIETIFSEIIDIEKRSWKWKKGISINATVFKNFYLNLARAGAIKGWLSLWFLRLNGKNIAYGLFFNIKGRIEFLKMAYDERFYQSSPGSLLMLHAFEKLFASGGVRINMLAGNFYFKHRWQTVSENLCEVCIFKRDWYSKFLYVILYKLSVQDKLIRFDILLKRMLRKLNIHWKNSELSRMDQVSSGPWT